jgi:hypothetical protein
LAVDSRGVADALVVDAGLDEPDPGRAAGAASAAAHASPVPPGIAGDGRARWTLLADSAIDRVGLEAALGVVDSVEGAEWLEQRLGAATTAARPAGHHPRALTAASASSSPDPCVSPSDVAAGPATDGHRLEPDGHEFRGPGGDGDGAGQRGAAERAEAAESRHVAGAAAARAEVTYTPETAAADPTEVGLRTRAAGPPAHRAPAPQRERLPRR